MIKIIPVCRDEYDDNTCGAGGVNIFVKTAHLMGIRFYNYIRQHAAMAITTCMSPRVWRGCGGGATLLENPL